MESLGARVMLVAVLAACSCSAEHWGYGETRDEVYGPADWKHVASTCEGRHQSPVDIRNFKRPGKMPKLSLVYSNGNGRVIGSFTNNGHSPTFAIDKSHSRVTLSGGPLTGEYELQQFHFHFGCSSSKGSEHQVRGRAYSGELHLVFYNKKYGDFNTAVDKPDGLSVIGVFLTQVYGKRGNEVLNRVTKKLPDIEEEGEAVNFVEEDEIDLSKLVPPTKKFFTYAGSLTTPPCFESVRWIVLGKKLKATESQMKLFRELKSETGFANGLMCNNFRPVQPLNDRTILRIRKRY